MGLFSPFATSESPLPEDKVIGSQSLRSKLPNCIRCGKQICTHGYEFAGKVKLTDQTARTGSSVMCPACYFRFAKSNFIYNTLKELSVILLIGWVILGIIAVISRGTILGNITGVIAGVLFLAWFINWFFRIGLKEGYDNRVGELASYVAELPKGSVADIVDIEPHGLPYFLSPRQCVVPCPITVLVHRDNPLQDISIDDLARIYTGKVHSWKELGWEDKPIRTYAPKEPCSESGAFRRIVLDRNPCQPSESVSSSLILPSAMQQDQYGIGFALYSHHDQPALEQSLRRLRIDGQECSYEKDSYPLWVLPRDSLLGIKGDSATGT